MKGKIVVLCGIILGLVTNTVAAPAQSLNPAGLSCHSCIFAADDKGCNSTVLCQHDVSVCVTSITYADSVISIQKGCETKHLCYNREENNDDKCYNADNEFDGTCFFCCDTDNCNKHIPVFDQTKESDTEYSPPDRHTGQTTRPKNTNRPKSVQKPEPQATPKSRPTSRPGPSTRPRPSSQPKHTTRPKHTQRPKTTSKPAAALIRQMVTATAPPAPTTPQHPTQPILATNPPPAIAASTTSVTPCPHNQVSNNVISVGGGMKININIDFGNGFPGCGCQTQNAVTSQIPKALTTLPPAPSAVTPQQPQTSPPPASSPSTLASATSVQVTSTPTTSSSSAPVSTSTTQTSTTIGSKLTTSPSSTTASSTTTPSTNTASCLSCTDSTCQSQNTIKCPVSQPLCMNTISQDITGKRIFNKGCVTEADCLDKWWLKTAGLADCFLLDDKAQGPPGMVLNACSFCCKGDSCNKKAIPDDYWEP